MKIGFFHPHFKHVGGAENLIVSQAQYLRSLGASVSVISRVRDEAQWRTAFEGIALVPSRALSFRLRDLFQGRATQLAQRTAAVQAELAAFDAVIAHNFPTCTLLGAAAIRGKRAWYCNEPHRKLHLITANPRLHARVTSQPEHAQHSRAERFYARRLKGYQRAMRGEGRTRRLRDYDREHTPRIEIILANSEYTRDNLQRTYGGAAARVVYPMLRFPARGRARTGLDRSRGLQILAHSRLDAPKNLDHVVRGFALYRARSASAQLHVVGVGPERGRLNALCERLKLHESVRFHGFLPQAELERVYDACDVFALTPLDEPFGMVFPEAAARGLLWVGPDHGGPFEILDGGKLGEVCDPFAPEALVEAFERITGLSDADVDTRRARADEACRERFAAPTIGPQLADALGLDRSDHPAA